MANVAKLLRRLLERPTEMRFDDVEKLLESFGYVLRGSRGSHRRFEYPGHPMIVVPVTGRKVSRVYLTDLIHLLGLEVA